jgi:hypothetical protein
MFLDLNLTDWADHRLRFQNELFAAQNDILYAPLPWRKVAVVAVPSSTQITLDEVPLWVQPGAYLWLDGAAQEVAVVASVAGAVVTLQTAPVAVPEVGGHVYHAFPGRVPDSFVLRAPVPTVWQGPVRVSLEPGFVLDPLFPLGTAPGGGNPSWWPGPGSVDYGEFLSLLVLFLKPNRAEVVQVTVGRERDTVDYGFGRTSTFNPFDFNSVAYRVRFTFRSVLDSERFVTFFRTLKGQRTPFWMPSFTQDFIDIVPAGLNGIDVRDLGHALLDGSRTNRYVVAFWASGTRQINEVTSITTELGRTEILFEDNWIEDIGEAHRVEWLQAVRFSSDTLSVSWRTPSVSEVSIVVMTLPVEEMEEFHNA